MGTSVEGRLPHAVRVVVDPGQSAAVEVVAGAGDGDVGKAGFGVVDGAGYRVSVRVVLVGVLGRGEVAGEVPPLNWTA